MTPRLVLHATVLATFLLVLSGVPTRADEEHVSQDAIEAAQAHDLDAVEVQGAANSTRTDPWTYVAWLMAPPPVPAARTVRVRLTYYVEGGVTYGGGRTYPGSTACSWNFPLGSRFRFPHGEVFTCNDRGLLGSSGWLDLWRRADIARAYGPYVTVEVLA